MVKRGQQAQQAQMELPVQPVPTVLPVQRDLQELMGQAVAQLALPAQQD